MVEKIVTHRGQGDEQAKPLAALLQGQVGKLECAGNHLSDQRTSDGSMAGEGDSTLSRTTGI